MKNIVKLSNRLLERGMIPDPVIRVGIRSLLRQKLEDEYRAGLEFGQERVQRLIDQLKASPIAVNMSEANEQHYEVPTEFFQYVMGKYMKYSCGYWRNGNVSFDQSEEDMLEITTERAELANGQSILELGCGWGSLSLFMAEKYPLAKIVAVSNSATQKKYIDSQIQARGIKNLEIRTADMNEFQISTKFDRVVSVEMFEHMRNYQKLLSKISGFLKDDGKLFVHIFTHREFAYLYDEADDSDWIAKYFFTGGIMPSDDLLLYFQDQFVINHHWRVSGTHYQKTAEGWLKNMDHHRKEIWPILEQTYGTGQATKWWTYWRVFFMSCAELWGYNQGNDWMVSHYLFRKR